MEASLVPPGWRLEHCSLHAPGWRLQAPSSRLEAVRRKGNGAIAGADSDGDGDGDVGVIGKPLIRAGADVTEPACD